MPWPSDWDRAGVLGAIEEASGVSLSVEDTLPDTLIAVAQAEGLEPVDLRLWIHDLPRHPWTSEHLRAWAARLKSSRVDAEGEGTDEIPRGDDGVQEARR